MGIRRRAWMRLGYCVLLISAALWFVQPNEEARKPASVTRNISADTAPTTEARPDYAFSVVKHGVHDREAVNSAMDRDPVVRAHYKRIDPSQLRVVSTRHRSEMYVSYRKKDIVYWTSKPVSIPAGEKVLTDGATTIRARCGNLLSPVPQSPVNPERAEEPTPADLDRVVAAALNASLPVFNTYAPTGSIGQHPLRSAGVSSAGHSGASTPAQGSASSSSVMGFPTASNSAGGPLILLGKTPAGIAPHAEYGFGAVLPASLLEEMMGEPATSFPPQTRNPQPLQGGTPTIVAVQPPPVQPGLSTTTPPPFTPPQNGNATGGSQRPPIAESITEEEKPEDPRATPGVPMSPLPITPARQPSPQELFVPEPSTFSLLLMGVLLGLLVLAITRDGGLRFRIGRYIGR